MVAMHDRAGAHGAGEFLQHGIPRRMAAGGFVRDQDIGFLGRERIDILRPDRGRGQRMRQRRALVQAIGRTKLRHVVPQLRPVRKPWFLWRRPNPGTKGPAKPSDSNPLDLPDLGVQRALGRDRIALWRGEVRPHVWPAIVVMVPVNPMHRDAAGDKRRGQLVQRLVALDVAKENGGFGERGERGEAGFDMMPVLVNVADENEGHAVPDQGAVCYHGAMATVRKTPRVRMTLAEFLNWEPGGAPERTWQLIDGEPVAMAPGGRAHGAIQAELCALLRNHLLENRPSCQVAVEPGIVPRIRADRNYRIPDIGVTCAPLAPGQMLPDPVLLVEILSPGNEASTWSNVWAYASIPSVTEILVVHSTRIAAEVLRRDPDGQWPDAPLPVGSEDILTLQSLGFSVPLKALYRTTWMASA